MKTIEVDDALYRYIASHTQHIGESASDILRRMLNLAPFNVNDVSEDPVQPIESEAVTVTADAVQLIQALRDSDQFQAKKRAVDRFLLLLSTLYQIDSNAFREATESLQGRVRVYFSTSKETLLKSGRHTKPRHIEQTPLWVITNTNTARKRAMIEHIMSAMQLPIELTKAMSLMI